MSDYAVLQVSAETEGQLGSGLVNDWCDSADEAILSAAALNEDPPEGTVYRAVETTRFGTWHSLTGESLYSS